LIETGLIAFLFVLAGFALALINEGSAAERLGKPVSGRDMAAIALLGIGCMTVFYTLQKRWETELYEVSGLHVLRNEHPKIAVSYNDEQYREQAEVIVDSLSDVLANFKADIGLDELPQVQITLNTELEKTEVTIELLDGVLLAANFEEYDDFEYSLLNAFAMHHVLLSLTNERWDFETRHWLLDGFARWWTEGASQAASSANNDELYALALLAQRRIDKFANPLHKWQRVTERLGIEATDALSYSAIVYLAQIKGNSTVIELAAEYINWQEFNEQWLDWLRDFESRPNVSKLVAAVPRLKGEVTAVVDDLGVHRLEGRYFELDGFVSGVAGQCVLRHQLTSPYDIETWIQNRERDRQNCVTDTIAHNVESDYAPGDRVFSVLEFESEQFHRPIPLWVGRIHVK